jgi:hypothetical protein
MINRVTAFQAADQTFATLEEAQVFEITAILKEDGKNKDEASDLAARAIVAAKARVLDILSTGPRSRPSRRKINRKAGAKPQEAKA